jgi:hypothetical protein
VELPKPSSNIALIPAYENSLQGRYSYLVISHELDSYDIFRITQDNQTFSKVFWTSHILIFIFTSSI